MRGVVVGFGPSWTLAKEAVVVRLGCVHGNGEEQHWTVAAKAAWGAHLAEVLSQPPYVAPPGRVHVALACVRESLAGLQVDDWGFQVMDVTPHKRAKRVFGVGDVDVSLLNGTGDDICWLAWTRVKLDWTKRRA